MKSGESKASKYGTSADMFAKLFAGCIPISYEEMKKEFGDRPDFEQAWKKISGMSNNAQRNGGILNLDES